MVIYELDDGRWVNLDARDVAKYGVGTLLTHMGIEIDMSPVEVRQDGRVVGTLPGDFDPLYIRSSTFLYDPRPGDFIRRDDHWEASKWLGPGDLKAVPGFVWKEPMPNGTAE